MFRWLNLWNVEAQMVDHLIKEQLIYIGVLKKDRHQNGNHINFDRACSWRCLALEKLINSLNEEWNREVWEAESLQLYEMDIIQYIIFLFNCVSQYLRPINLKLYQIIEKREYFANQMNTLRKHQDFESNTENDDKTRKSEKTLQHRRNQSIQRKGIRTTTTISNLNKIQQNQKMARKDRDC